LKKLFIYSSLAIFLISGCKTLGKKEAVLCNFPAVRESYLFDKYDEVIAKEDMITSLDVSQNDNARCLYYLAISYGASSDFKNARKCLNILRRKKRKIDFAPLLDLTYAEMYFQEGKYLSAVKAYEDFIEDYPDDDHMPAACFNMGLSLQQLGKFEKARDVLWEITKKYPLSFEGEYVKNSDIANIEGFVLQVAAFYDENGAQEKVKELKAEGLDAAYFQLQKNGTPYYRVYVDSYKTRNDADKTRLQLIEKGYDPLVFP